MKIDETGREDKDNNMTDDAINDPHGFPYVSREEDEEEPMFNYLTSAENNRLITNPPISEPCWAE